jgi:hypothetical protein
LNDGGFLHSQCPFFEHLHPKHPSLDRTRTPSRFTEQIIVRCRIVGIFGIGHLAKSFEVGDEPWVGRSIVNASAATGFSGFC